jgi:LPS export ABC transporter protein LptC
MSRRPVPASAIAAITAVGLIAAAAGCVNESTKPTLARTVADTADQVLYKMSTIESSDGLRRAIVYAETAYVYQSTQKMDLRQLRVTFFDEQGKESSRLVANQGLYTITNGSLDARGAVNVKSVDGKTLVTEHLIYDKAALRLKIDTTFVYNTPTEHLVGVSGTSDLEFKHVIVDKPRGNQRGAGLVIPGQ